MPERELTPDSITARVMAQEIATENLRTRMENDYGRYLLEWKDDRWEDGEAPEGYHTYISNGPRVFADRIIALLVSAAVNARVPYGDAKAEDRKSGLAKERFFRWALREADKTLRQQVLPESKPQLAFHIVIRGWFCGRALLYKDETGATKADITPFDPMHTFYGVGSDGLVWVCHKLLKTRDEIAAEYGEDAAAAAMPNAGPSEGQASDSDQGITVYDYYDKTNNAVVIGKDFVKDPTPHGARRVPVFMGLVGSSPFVQRKDETNIKDLLGEVGESIYAGLRMVYDTINKTLSDRVTLVRRTVDPGYVLESETGTKTLDSNPFVEQSEVPLKKGEKLTPLQLQEMTRDTDLLLAQLTGEEQRGSIPHTTYGDIQFQLSGYAINTLRKGLELRIQDGVLALKSAYMQISELLCEQYSTGMFVPVMATEGFGQSYYKEQIDPAKVAQADNLEIEIVPRLPKDDVAMYSMAQIAREGKQPLVSHRTALDSILQLDNADGEIQLIKEEMAEMASPLAALTTLLQTAIDRGRFDLAAIYYVELERMKMQMMMPPGMPMPGQAPQNGASAPPGQPPQVSPAQAQGFPQPAPGAPNMAPVPQSGTQQMMPPLR